MPSRLAIDDAPLDVAAPVVAVGLLLAAELALLVARRARGSGRGAGRGPPSSRATPHCSASRRCSSPAFCSHSSTRCERGGLALDLVGAVAVVAVFVTVLVTARRELRRD